MTYELEVPQFKGPLDKLLELIEAEKMEVTEISLARVTDDFLKYIRTLEEVQASVLADFLVVASRLIFLKSKMLLPSLALTEDEEGEIKDLEARLKLYQELKPALKLLSGLWAKQNRAYSRPYFLSMGEGIEGMFYPGEGITASGLADSFERLFESLQKLELETQTIKETIISIEEKMQEVVERVTREISTSMNSLTSGRPVAEVIAIFLAILHLAREQKIVLEQAASFSDIIIGKPAGEPADSEEEKGFGIDSYRME